MLLLLEREYRGGGSAIRTSRDDYSIHDRRALHNGDSWRLFTWNSRLSHLGCRYTYLVGHGTHLICLCHVPVVRLGDTKVKIFDLWNLRTISFRENSFLLKQDLEEAGSDGGYDIR